MKSKHSDLLSESLSEYLGKRECFGVVASHETTVRAFWKAFPVSFVGNSEGVVLFVALSESRRMALKAAVSAQKSEDIPQIQLTTPQILEQLIAVDGARFAQMMGLCRRIIVWLHPDDFGDDALDYWFEIAARLPGPNIAYLEVPAAEKARFERMCPGMHWIDASANACNFVPVVHYLENDKLPGEILSHEFWKCCKNRRTLVSCNSHGLSVLCEEAAHHAHLSTFHSGEKRDAFEQMVFVPDLYADYASNPAVWEHGVWIDPLPACGFLDTMADAFESPKSVSLVVSNHFSLLITLAALLLPQGRLSHDDAEDVLFCAYRLYSRLQAGLLTDKAAGTPRERAILTFWAEQGFMTGSREIELSHFGRNLFAGVSHFARLGALHGYGHKVVCEGLNHESLGIIPADFLKGMESSSFHFGGQFWQCAYYHSLEHQAVLKGSCGNQSHWIDALPVYLDDEQAQAVRSVIFDEVSADGVILSQIPAREWAQIREQFRGIRDRNWIEITPGAAQWWTFAGARNNDLTAAILKFLAPKLDVSQGNLGLLLRWRVSGDWQAEPVLKRLKALSQEILRFAGQGLAPDCRRAVLEQWKHAHPRESLFVLLPPEIQDECFDSDFDAWAKCMQEPAIFEVDALHELDGCVMPPPLRDRTAKAPKSPCAKPVSKVSPPGGPQSSEPPATGTYRPIERGDGSIMHTRYPWTYIADARSLANAINRMLSEPFIGLDVETTLFDQRLCLIQIGCADQSFLIDPLCVDFSPLAQVFENPNLIKIIHNSSFECKVLGKYGIQIHNIADTLKISRKRYGMKCPGGHSLRAVCLREFGYDMDKTNQTSRWDKRPLTADQLEYAALDAEILIHLYRHFMDEK